MIHTSRQLKDLVRNLSNETGIEVHVLIRKYIMESVLVTLKDSALMHDLWKSYQRKFPYAADYSWNDVMWSARKLAHEAGLPVEKPSVIER